MTQARRDERRSTDFSAVVMTPSGAPRGRGRVKNLSHTGLCLSAKDALGFPPGASIGVEIPADAERGRITILGEVRWTDGREAGVQVAAMVPHHRARYARLLHALDTAPPRLPASLTSTEGDAVVSAAHAPISR